MIEIHPKIYEKLTKLLIDKLEVSDFYSDITRFDVESMEYHFSATLMIYRKKVQYPEGEELEICDIVPIWWEFHSSSEDGEQLNDFDFAILKEYICQQ